jgi:putative FmdB family regulatory protein
VSESVEECGMPIYEYRCASCGFQSEYLQKVSDPPRSVCPQCAQPTFNKLVTAAGFQLKGSGWYATDFKGKGTAPGPAEKKDGAEAKPAGDTKESKSSTEGSKSSTEGSKSSTGAAAADASTTGS